MQNLQLKTIFFGTPDFSIPALEMLKNHPYINLVLVVCNSDRPAGRGLKVKSQPTSQFANDNKVEVFQTDNLNAEQSLLDTLTKIKPDLFIVLAFSQFLSSKFLNLPRLGCFNIHTSVLPKYRGAAPIQYALLNGDKETGVSIQHMVKKMDAGDVVHKAHVEISEMEDFPQLYTRLKFYSALCLNDFLDILLKNRINPEAQDSAQVTFAPSIKKTDGMINFLKEDASKVCNKIRAFKPWPGTYFFINGKMIKILKARAHSGCDIPAGDIRIANGKFLIGCISNSHLEILELWPEGKKPQSSKDFINGVKNFQDLKITYEK